MSGPVNAPRKNRNARTAWTMAAVVGGMLGLAYASAPLYDLFCRTTGFGGTPRIAGRHLEVLLDNVGRFTRGEPLRNVADKREWY